MFFFFANWLKLGRDAALVFCDIFKTLVKCLTYVAAGTPTSSKKVAVQKVKPNAGRVQKLKVSRFLPSCKIIQS